MGGGGGTHHRCAMENCNMTFAFIEIGSFDSLTWVILLRAFCGDMEWSAIDALSSQRFRGVTLYAMG